MRRIFIIWLVGIIWVLGAACGRGAVVGTLSRAQERLEALHGAAPTAAPAIRRSDARHVPLPRPRPASPVPAAPKPAIVVLAPAGGARVHSPIAVSGTADVFEARFVLRLLDAQGHELARAQVQASCGTGCRGTYSANLPYSLPAEQAGTVEAFQQSARDGSAFGVVRIPVVLSASVDPGPYPSLTVSPGSAPVGATVHLEGDGFTGDGWQSNPWVAIEASSGGDCWLIAEADASLSIDADGHLSGDMVVPAGGHCHQGVPDLEGRPVVPGTWGVAVGCTACTFGELVVTQD